MNGSTRAGAARKLARHASRSSCGDGDQREPGAGRIDGRSGMWPRRRADPLGTGDRVDEAALAAALRQHAGQRSVRPRPWRAPRSPSAWAAVGAPPPAPAKVNSPLLGLAMIIGLTDAASGVGAPSRMPVPGTTIARAEELPHRQAAGSGTALAVDRREAGEAAGIGRRRRRPAPVRSNPRAPRHPPPAAARHRHAGGRCRSFRRPAAPACGTASRSASSGRLPPICEIWSDRVRANVPWKKSTPPRWRIAPSVAGEFGLDQVVALAPHRACRRSAAPRDRAPSSAPPACRSRASARDTGTPNRARRSAGDTDLLPAHLAVTDMHQRHGAHAGRHRERHAVDRAGRRDRREDERLRPPWSCRCGRCRRPRRRGRAADGKVTARAKYMATAASVALPPFNRISRPTSAARLSSAATAAKEAAAENASTGRSARRAVPAGIGGIGGSIGCHVRLTSATSRQQEDANQRQAAQLTWPPRVPSLLADPCRPCSNASPSSSASSLLALAPLRAAVRSKVNGSISSATPRSKTPSGPSSSRSGGRPVSTPMRSRS